ncbi:PH domain-containing protein [Crateriforma conspicua]|uniref:Bacterial membrane flanked domain protein n=1 Tax=Crateriforma conspicua TaxID=2527996 RepID=A0A5C6FSM6_9PLAN|nr:PH domain-containing protein [Crateriforma conspicua]TWU63161.1 Bacterial membrane flanked domain protein [Crateriforma conspicua]
MISSTEAKPQDRALVYTCPICESTIGIEQHLIGETISCPHCDRPFEVVPPRAYPAKHGSDTDPSTILSADDLAEDEAIEKVIHPVVFRRHLLGTIVCVAAAIIGGLVLGLGVAGSSIEGITGLTLMIPGGVLLGIGLVFLMKWLIESRMHSLKLTNERMIYRYGIIHRGTSEIRHEDVRNLKVDQNLFERLFRFGDIAVSSAGQDDMEVIIHDIPNPEAVVDYIRKRQ